MAPADTRMIVDENNTLNIQNSKLHDSGQYRCIGSNMLGTMTSSVEIKVASSCQEYPVSASNLEFENGETYSFDCGIDVSPEIF